MRHLVLDYDLLKANIPYQHYGFAGLEENNEEYDDFDIRLKRKSIDVDKDFEEFMGGKFNKWIHNRVEVLHELFVENKTEEEIAKAIIVKNEIKRELERQAEEKEKTESYLRVLNS